MSSVQFRGTEQIMQAFNDNNGCGWAIFEGNKLLFKGIYSDTLEKNLHNMTACTPNSAYATTYSLRIYEDIKDRKKINYKTDWDCSFGFKLIAEDEEQTRRTERSNSRSNEIEQLKIELQQLKEEREDTNENDKLGIIGKIFTHPVLGNYAGMILGGILQNVIPGMRNMPALPAAINGLPGNAIAGNGDTDQQNLSLDEIVKQLQQHDPRIKQHLYKLLQIAIHNKPSFDFLTNTLDSM